jgi:hypothetical protein
VKRYQSCQAGLQAQPGSQNQCVVLCISHGFAFTHLSAERQHFHSGADIAAQHPYPPWRSTFPRGSNNSKGLLRADTRLRRNIGALFLRISIEAHDAPCRCCTLLPLH